MSKLVWIDGSLYRVVIPAAQSFHLDRRRLDTLDCAILTSTGGIVPTDVAAIYQSSTVSLPMDKLSSPPSAFCPLLIPGAVGKNGFWEQDTGMLAGIPDGEYLELGGAFYGSRLLNWSRIMRNAGLVMSAGPLFQEGYSLAFCDTPLRRSERLTFRRVTDGLLLAHTLIREVTYRQIEKMGYA